MTMTADLFPLPSVLVSLPPSAKLVYVTLSAHGPERASDLQARTRLPPRTLHHALDELQAADVVETRPCLEDGRALEYVLADSGRVTSSDA